MITRISGLLVALNESSATVRVGGFDYQVLVPDVVRRQLQSRVNEEIVLRTMEFLEGNPQQGRLVPRMIGFTSEAEQSFFEHFCSVDGVGVRKALRAMVRPVREIAVAVEEQDVKGLSALPGIGPAMAERIVAKLRRKMTRFALMASSEVPVASDAPADLVAEAFEALVSVGHSPQDARNRIESVVEGSRKFRTVEEVLTEIYQKQRS
jgi:Holliday junction DNA helicase RuvA